MLSDERIQEAKNNVRSYMQEGMLEKKIFNPLIFEILKANNV